MSIAGLVLLIIKASNYHTFEVTIVIIFGTTMVLLYTISCVYHGLSSKIKGKKVLRVLDHCNVYLLVFGTVIPIALLGITSVSGWIFLGVVGFVTTLGIIASVINLDKFQIFEVICHLVNGWSVLFFSNDLIANIGMVGFAFIILGGVFYSLGAILYGIGTKKKYMHSVFHFFCLAGTTFHYLGYYSTIEK